MENKKINPKVSILVPIYGVEKYIEKCAISLMEQTYQNIEYIFVNDCTKDGSIDILKNVIERFPNRKDKVRIISHERNRGLSAARNTGVDTCSGDYLMHVDSDDWLDLNAVNSLVEFVQTNPTQIVLFANYSVYKDKTIQNHCQQVGKDEYIKSVLMHSTPASIWNKFYNAQFYKTSGIRSVEGLNHGEDYVVVPRLVHKAETFAVLDMPLYYYNQMNEGSYMKNIGSKSILDLLNAAKILDEYFKKIEDIDEYKPMADAIFVRTMLALVKLANWHCYKEIYQIFCPFVNKSVSVSVTDNILLLMLRLHLWRSIGIIIKVYNK